MGERLDAHLDGALPLDDLSAEERAQAAAFEAKLSALRSSLSERSPADMHTRVMRRITELGLEPLPARANVVHRAWDALWSVRELNLRWRPAYGLAAAALLAAVVLLPWLRTGAPDMADRGQVVNATAAPVYVQFRLHVNSARQVELAGSFTNWVPAHALQQVADGVWTVVLPIQPGVHDYAFVVDGERWVADPYAPQVDDGFGGTNSRLTLLAPSAL